ncbi:MAG: beta strand repeat-containing protein, partial [Nitrososphaerales archaeon]
IVDTTAPTLKAPKNIVAEATDPLANIVQIGSAEATDIIAVESITHDAPDVFPIGLTTITWTARDTSGNVVNASQTVTINDTTKPTITAPTDIAVEAASASGNTVSIGDAVAADIIGIQSITNDAPATFPLGETTVTWTAVDTHGNSATTTQKITVVDTTAPSIIAPADITSEALDPLGNILSVGNATAEDTVGVTLITNDAPAVFPLGETIVSWTATDAAGNFATTTQKISVVDTTPPTIVAPDPVGAEATSATENVVNLGQATAADFVGISSITSDAPAVFPVGETVVTWTATDTANHTATTTQIVTIKDTTSPILTAPKAITAEATGESENIVNIGQTTASDLVGIASITSDAPAVFPIGLTTISWTATDTSGNSVTATQTVTIVDTTTPTILAPADVSVEASDPTSNIVAIGTATTSDAVGVVSVTSDAPSVFTFGQTIVTWIATDAAGNNATYTQTITVVDTTAPKVFAPADVTANATDPTNNTISIGTASATDIIGVASITSDAPAAFPFGETIVTWTAIDSFGNIATANQTISVIDTTVPSIIPPADITIEAQNQASNLVSLGIATAEDIVGVALIEVDAPSVFPLGETIVTWV